MIEVESRKSDYSLLVLYFLAFKDGKLSSRQKREFERLRGIYDLDSIAQSTYNELTELRYIKHNGSLEKGEWVLDKENPTEITSMGLKALSESFFQSETAKKAKKARDKRLARISVIIAIVGGLVGLIGGSLSIYAFFRNLFV